jgi:D-aminoacyl-tRNA deacylase
MGNVGITLSTSDPAGANMLSRFREMGFRETESPEILRLDELYLIVLEPLIVPEERYKIPKEPDPYPAEYDALASTYDLDYIVVASRHSSRSGKPSLTVHPTGNFGKAMYGGRPRELQWIVANPMRDVYLELLRDPPRGYDISMEATHHSPTQFETPMFFAELGSSKRQWRDESIARYLTEAIVDGIRARGEAPVAIGFGGGHYCPTFSVLERETAFGHIAAKHSLDLLTPELIGQMVEKTKEGVERAIFDKGLKGHQRKKVEVALKKLGLEYGT